jgi:hypothetical protein
MWKEIAGQHLRLFPEDNAQGVQVSVYDVNAKCCNCLLRRCQGY